MLSPFIPSDLVYFTFFHFLPLHVSSRVTSILFPASNRVTSIYQIQKVEKISISISPFFFLSMLNSYLTNVIIVIGVK